MAGNVKGITIEFRGNPTPLQAALKKIRKETKETGNELTAVNRSLKFNPTSVEMWRQKQQLLTKAVADTDKHLDELKKAQADLGDDDVAKNSAEYRELEREILKTENKQKRLNAELRQIPTPQIRAAAEEMKILGDKAKTAGTYMTTHFTAPIAAGYTAAAKYASDYEENLNKLDVAFGENSQSVKDWANNARDAYGMSAVQATQAASAFGALGKGIGLSEEDAASMSTTLAGLSADLGSYYNVSNEDSAKALEGIFTGESEALKKFGVVMTDTNLKQFAEDQGLVWSEMSQTEKTMLRYNFVMAKTQDAQGDFSRTSDGTANSIKIFKATVQDLATAIGTNLLPIITPVIQKVTEWIGKFNELSPTTQKIITYIGLFVAAIGPVLVIIGTLLSSIGAILTTGPLIVGAIAGVAGALGGIISASVPVIAAIGALIAVGVALYKNWDQVKAFAVKVWDGIKNAIVTPIEAAKNKIKGIMDKIKSFFPLKIGKIFSDLKIPHIDISGGKAPYGIGGLGKKPSISVSWHAQGGIFDSPTLLMGRDGSFHGVGESGAEAIVPLDKLWNNMEKLANASSNSIVINVYGAEGQSARAIAEEVKKQLIQETNRRRVAWQ